MIKTISFLTLLLLVYTGHCQVVTCDPEIPVANQGVAIIFHSDRGNKGLMNYSGDDVYAHTGVITDKSLDNKDWQYVKAGWDEENPACKLTKLSANEYKLVISPSIREFYNVPSGEKILKIAFVFRNSTGLITGREVSGADIFADVVEAGLQVSFIQPADRFSFIGSGENVAVQINASESDSVFLYLDDVLLKKATGVSIDTIVEPENSMLHKLVAAASKGTKMSFDTTWFMVPGAITEGPLPEGIRDGINYVADDSVVFSIFAPGKESIFLIGDFNKWLPDSIYQFKKSGDIYWISIGNLTPGKEYAFQYVIDESLVIADPYSEKILDPKNDKHIPETVYPGLLPYPAGMAQGITGVIQPGKPDYIWGDDAFVAPPYKDLVIYELLIRDFVSTHDIKDVRDKLDYLQTLGINAIELMPFSEFEENSSWGYNPSFYFATDKYYGRENDIKDFIQECHNRGIAVIMDMVLNHAYGQNPMVRMYYNTSLNRPSADNPWFNETSPNTVFSWGNDFNHESPATKYFVDRVVEYWLQEYKVDGFRFDFTKGFTNTPGDGSTYDASRITILKRIYDKMHSVNASAYMICEHFAPNTEEKELADYGMLIWGNSNYNYNEATMGYVNNSDLSWASYKARGWSNPALVSYMESHDEERLMFKNITYGNSSGSYNIKDPATALKRQELAGAFFFTIPGPKMVWQFGELGYDVSIDFNGRVGEKPVKWEYYNDPFRKQVYLVWAKLLDLRKKYPVFSTNDFTLNTGNNISLKKITLRHADGDVIVVGNFGLAESEMQPGFTGTGKWFDLFSGDSVDISDVNHSITLAAGEYRIFAASKMESVINSAFENRHETMAVYPNPATDEIYFDTGSPAHVEIYNLSGIRMFSLASPAGNNFIDISRLPGGIYVIRAVSGSTVLTGRFVKR